MTNNRDGPSLNSNTSMVRQNTMQILVLLLRICVLNVVIPMETQATQQNIHIQRYQGFRLVNSYQELEARSLFDCGAQCTKDNQCTAANFHAVNRKCQFNSDTFGTGIKEDNSEWEVLDGQPWHVFDAFEYLPLYNKSSWDDAKETCEFYNSYLADVTSEEENIFITDLMTDSSGPICWLGGSDPDHQNDWKWLSGTSISGYYSSSGSYENWDGNQPGLANEFCLGLYHANNGKWHDVNCSGKKTGVCKRSLL